MEEGEEERATAVPNREGKAKIRWTVASLPQFTKGAPAYTSVRKYSYYSPLFHRYVGTGPHVNETWCVISSAKFDLAALARGAALVINLNFLMACCSVLKHD